MIGILLICGASAVNLRWYAPQWLSYYSLAIGGLPGATALGMEPTYYWDGLDQTAGRGVPQLDGLLAHQCCPRLVVGEKGVHALGAPNGQAA